MKNKKNRYFFNGLFVVGLVALFCAFILVVKSVSNNKNVQIKTVNTIGSYNSDYEKLLKEAGNYNDRGSFDEALKLLKKCEKSSGNDSRVFREEGYAYFEKGEYEKSLNAYEKVLGKSPNDAESKTWYAYDLLNLNETDKALEKCNEVLKINTGYAFAYSVRGLVLYSAGDEAGSIQSLDKAIAIEPGNGDYYDNKVYILYNLKRYSECIEACRAAEKKFPQNQDFYYYAAESCSALGNDKDAINEYNKILKMTPKDDQMLGYVAEQYYYMEDYSKSLEYVNKALDINPSNSFAKDLKSDIEEAEKPETVRIVDFIKKNYLYLDEVRDFDAKAQQFEKKQNLSSEDINNFVQSVKLKDDKYTYVVESKYYDYYTSRDETPQITYNELNNNTCIIAVKSFSMNVGDAFARIIDKIKDTRNKNLIIDLRGNGGGAIDSANDILDVLLPQCTSSYLVGRDGSIRDYKSDSCSVKFRKIAVLVDENSASSSELLTLGLKKYLNNVVVIGHPTVGKGVGQVTFESKKNRYFIYLVSFYWNVKEKNITGDRIHPDILLQGSKDSDYINAAIKYFK